MNKRGVALVCMKREKGRIQYLMVLGSFLAVGMYFGAYHMAFIPIFNVVYARSIGVLTMLYSVECILSACAGILLTALSGLAGLGLAILLGLESRSGGRDSCRQRSDSSKRGRASWNFA